LVAWVVAVLLAACAGRGRAGPAAQPARGPMAAGTKLANSGAAGEASAGVANAATNGPLGRGGQAAGGARMAALVPLKVAASLVDSSLLQELEASGYVAGLYQ